MAHPSTISENLVNRLFTGRIEARAYQIRIVDKALAMFDGRYVGESGAIEPAVASLLIQSPTGSGKTVMGLALARLMQQWHRCRVGWCAHRRNLLAQAQRENQRWGLGVDMELISMFDKHPPRVDLLVVDEAQHDGALSLRNLYCDIQPKYILGLTATPYRTDRIKLSFAKQITDADIHQLIEMGCLSPYRHFTMAGNYDPPNVAGIYASEPGRWGQTLMFFPRLEACRQCQAMLAGRGIQAEVVTGTSNRERQMEEFAAGKIPILLSMAILAEGFDCPSLETVFLRPSGKACTIQMGGRVLRKHPGLAAKNIVQCQHTRCAFPRVARPAEQYAWVDGQWRTLSINPRIAAIAGRALQEIARTQVRLPEVLSRKKRQRWPREE